MQRFISLLLLAILFCGGAAKAEEYDHPGHKPDDRIIFDLAAEDWVTTKTAHVIVAVEAAVTANTAGTTRTDMTKAVEALAKGDWRLTSFNRSQDQSGMEHWSALFEARLAESDLGGLNDAAKKASKAGMQISVANIDFSPTLDELEAARGNLRTQIYKIANDQLATLNATLPGRNYRIALVNFSGDDDSTPMPRVVKGQAAFAMMAQVKGGPGSVPDASPAPSMERSEKISLGARIVFAASEGKPAAMPAPAPAPTPSK